MLPIILADRMFKDDVPRLLYGYSGWREGDGRPVTEWIIYQLSGNRGVVADMTPLPHILSIVLMAYCVAVFVGAVFRFEKSSDTFGGLIAAAVMFFSPFLLENFSYQLDVISHVIAACSMMLVFVVDKSEKRKIDPLYLIVVVLLCLCTLCTYQTAIGMIMGLCVLDMLIRTVDGRKLDIWLQCHRAVGTLIAVLLYRFWIIPAVGAEYAGNANADQGLIASAVGEYSRIFNKLSVYLQESPRTVVICTALLVVAFDVTVILKEIKSEDALIKKICASLFVVLAPLLIFIMSFAPMAASGTGVSPRTIISFVVCTIYLSYAATYLLNLDNLFRYAMLLILPFFCFAFIYMYIYGAAEKNQAEFDSYMATNLIYDIEEANADHQYSYITIIGNPGYSRYYDHVPYSYNYVYTNFWSHDWMGGEYLWGYTRYPLNYSDEEVDRDKCVTVKTSAMYDVCTIEDEGRIVVFIKL